LWGHCASKSSLARAKESLSQSPDIIFVLFSLAEDNRGFKSLPQA